MTKESTPLDKRITFQTKDGCIWRDVATIWASGKEYKKLGRSYYIFTCRYRTGLHTDMRIKFEDKYFLIFQMEHITGKEILEISAKEQLAESPTAALPPAPCNAEVIERVAEAIHFESCMMNMEITPDEFSVLAKAAIAAMPAQPDIGIPITEQNQPSQPDFKAVAGELAALLKQVRALVAKALPSNRDEEIIMEIFELLANSDALTETTNQRGDIITEFRPKMDAVILKLVGGKPIILIEFVDPENLPKLRDLAIKMIQVL